ncbi:MAG: hypothetical protein HRU09_19375 [Oligoflexales bacterium]|nr:hypothetical protein [Oligoflexales bacterium]
MVDPFSLDNSNRNKVDQKSSKPQQSELDRAIGELLQSFILCSSTGLLALLRSFFSVRVFLSIPILAGLFWACILVAQPGLHIQWLHDLAPEILSYERLKWVYKYSVYQHATVLFIPPFLCLVVFIGAWVRSERGRYHMIFLKTGLTNGAGETPKLLKKMKVDKYRSSLHLAANSISLKDFQAKKDRLEATFKRTIESIEYGNNQGRIIITFSTAKFPSHVSYEKIRLQKDLPEDSFFLGSTIDQVKYQKVSELPHLLIAGTTGSGKSMFFRQALLVLLESSKHLQMYCIDLKGGLEMIDFKASPNVKVVKQIDRAVALLREIKKEMSNRFEYLEKNGLKHIVPERDHMDRIIVAVDEASVLYMSRNKYDEDYQASIEARQLADSIAKVSRAAGIHLLLATQKLDKTVIPTSVSENISGRMAFRANSLQGSLAVMGTKDALDLPEIPGRGLWNFGTQKVMLQTPFVSEETVKQRCIEIAKEFNSGDRKLFNPMIGDVTKKSAKRGKAAIYRTN